MKRFTLSSRKNLARMITVLGLLWVLPGAALHSWAGVVLRLGYNGITGANVSDLTSNPAFPGSPTVYDVLTTNLMIPPNVANDYGSWIRGFIEAPQTGDYTFWLQAVDSGELWLSTSEDPSAKVLISQNPFTLGQGPNDWFMVPAQQSAPVHLVRGQKYYFEVLHKEDSAGTYDSCAVAWTLPDGTFEGPIPGKYLWPFPVNLSDPSYPPISKAPEVLAAYSGVLVPTLDAFFSPADGGSLDLGLTVEASQPATVQWYSNDVVIPNANLLTYHIDRVTTAMNGAVYSVKIQNGLGQATASTTLSVFADSTPPVLLDVLNLANAAGDIAVVFSKPVDPVSATVMGNYSISPAVGITSVRMGASSDTVLLQTAGLAVGTAYTLTVNNVQDRATTPNTIAPASSMPIEQFLGAWYRMDESTGTTSSDSSGKGLNGTLVADAAPGYAGKVLKSVKMRGLSGGYVRLPVGFSDFTTNGMTVSFWAYPTSEGAVANWARFIDFANGPANDNILFARTGDANQLTFEVYVANTTGGKVTAPLGSLIVNQWQHFAATMDAGGNVTIYRNGVPVMTGLTGVPNNVQRNNNYIGLSNWTGDGHYAGGMDDVRLYNRVLSPAAIAALAGGGGLDDTDASMPIVSAVATVATTALKNTPPGVITITRSGSTAAPLTVQFSLSGTATNGVVYQTLPTSVTIPAGTNSVPVLIRPIDYSFQGAQRTAILTLSGSVSYAIAQADSGTVTIQNNDAGPAAIAATTDNGLATGVVTADVWFAAPVVNPSATTLANYTLINAPGVSITSAILTNRNLHVILGLSASVPDGTDLGVTNVLDPGANTVSARIPLRLRLAPVNLVADVYHSPDNDRVACYTLATDGIIDNLNNGAGFDTWSGGGRPSEFVGVLYDHNQDFEVIKVDLGNQFGDGGSWVTQPKVYILKNPVDSNQTRPETDPADWTEVPATLISGSQFQATIDPSPSPNTPIVFNLSGLSASQRNGYGWAVGGVKGSGSSDFISISEVTAYGSAGATPAFAFITQPADATVTAGQRARFEVLAQSTVPLTYQWMKDSSFVFDGTASYYGTPPTLLADNGSQFLVQVSAGALGTMNSAAATLHVLARTNPPVVAAAYDSINNLIDVWFNGATDPVSSQTPANYTLNDGSSGVLAATQQGQGCGVVLNLSAGLTVANPTLTVSGVLDPDGNTLATTTVPVLPLVIGATNVVANAYQQGRGAALTRSTDGVVINDVNTTTWTTYGSPAGSSDFVGLTYAEPQVFGVLKVDLGWQYADGGDWGAQPMVYILKHPLDTNQKAPETDPLDWEAVPASLVSANIFGSNPDQPVNTTPLINSPIVFDLSHLPLADRTGWGWAVGGVPGNGPIAQFVSIAEARAFGPSASSLSGVAGAPQILLDVTPASPMLPVGMSFSLSVPLIVGTTPFSYQWQQNGANLSNNGHVSGANSPSLNLSAAVLGDSGDYRLIVNNSSGSATSSVAHVTITPTITFNGNGAGWTPNTATTNVPVAGNVLTLTDGGLNEARSFFFNYPLYIGSFTASFTYQDIGGGGADGAAFVVQNSVAGATALGGGGGGLGYAGITPSAALEINVYLPNTVGVNLRNNGATGGPYAPTGPVNLASGHPIDFLIGYDGTTLSLALTDTVAATTFTTNMVVDLPSLAGGSTAWVGFTGASGGVASFEQISNFSFANQVTSRPVLSAQTMPGNMLLLSWPASASGFNPYQTSDLAGGIWTLVPGTPVLVGGQYQLQVLISGQRSFFRLQQ